MMEKMSVRIRVPMPGKGIEEACKALESEVEFKGKSRISLCGDKGALVVDISSDDVSSLHAAAGSMLRAIKVVLSVAGAKGKEE